MKGHPYKGIVAALATMHLKEIAIAPPLSEIVGLRVVTPKGIDTDVLGTFAGDIPRVGSMGEVATRKARMGMKLANTAIGLASEGTFGPHPAVPFATAGMELLKLVDDERGIEISESLVTAKIVFQSAIARSVDELDSFLARSRFPSHGLIARPNRSENSAEIIKDILSRDDLVAAFDRLTAASIDGMVIVSTDMRAHRNPTRMRSLSEIASRFARRVASLCPVCACPGFGRSGQIEGLPCETCGTPTRSPKSEVFACVACGHQEIRARSDGRTHESPMHCDRCNP